MACGWSPAGEKSVCILKSSGSKIQGLRKNESGNSEPVVGRRSGVDPEIVLGDTTDTIVVGTTDGTLSELPIPAVRTKRVRSWREVY